jgi:hypothetical protein
MSNSGRKVNYSVRPAKNMERKMMRDMFMRLFPFSPLSEYCYLGFGSKYFVDFSLFHKSLHINRMISIEADSINRQRYQFNKPFDCIDIKFGHSQDVLPTLKYENKTIAWLDYDAKFALFMLGDISTLVERLLSGSVITLSYNSEPYTTDGLKDENGNMPNDPYRKKFTEIVGIDNIPIGFDERGWRNHKNFSKFLRKAVNARLTRAISERNLTLAPSEQLKYEQIMYFDYSDGQKMSTVSFIIYSEADTISFESCRFSGLPFFKGSDESYNIEVPNLTIKEIRHLMEKMPITGVFDDFNPKIFTEKDVTSFAANYKYFPSFNEIEIM